MTETKAADRAKSADLMAACRLLDAIGVPLDAPPEVIATVAAALAAERAAAPPDGRQNDELREALARAFADGVAMRRHMEPLTDRQWAIARAAWEDDIAPLLPVVTAWAEKQARARAAEELFVLASRLVSQDVGDLRVYDEIRALRDDLAGDPA